ncbi:Protein-export protein SecB [Hyphomicrobium sp. GJ21]|jgi:preprotein translocase subunit SecB|uniref:Protein-export protein SecB n=1 Tax=Hyphomicrobium denitrificans (strain ATCC 51888 / DSM 1869 / NCIMB 11706 / TK 0415) TaxID=582899 RepID=D8JWV4_HYPDA|nr:MULTISPECIES: protein-export chaperone SecB [Hyphomicrobium]ADJ25062.1 protein-export protein SecB [Hyphomicrobium denitrificans ATCC 51888]MBN9354448.1 protein-export chaperone SecB [Hyphomicrobium denitrificans]CEJ83334.1 Protein-export protein SecB [Hyphomicrobium sp. GJ21]
MAENGSSGNGSAEAVAAEGQQPIQAKIVSQYIKDLSFENPNFRKLITSPGDQPNLKVEVNVGAQRIENDLFESAIEFKATASNNLGTIYVLETVYAGVLKIESIPEQALEPFLLISGPTMIFPFLRRLVADITREGGFPPLLLDPIDFGGLYVRRQQQLAQSAGKTVA